MRSKQDIMTHEKAARSLPWLINGTLRDPERQAVDLHVRSCLVCRRELYEQRELSEVVQSSSLAGASRARSYDALMQRIDDGSPATRERADPDPDFNRRQWRRAILPLAASVAGLMLLAGLLTSGIDGSRFEPLFRTLTSDPPAVTSGPLVHVVFDRATTEDSLRQILRNHRMEIAGGPTRAGLYTLRPVSDIENLEGLLAALRARPEVVFAEPVASGGEF